MITPLKRGKLKRKLPYKPKAILFMLQKTNEVNVENAECVLQLTNFNNVL